MTEPTRFLFDIVIASPGLPHDGNTLKERSLGGSETAAIRIANALKDRGHHVTVFSPCTGGMIDGVMWRNIEQFCQYVTSTPHDVTIVSRAIEMTRFRFHSFIRVLWCHDLALKRSRAHIGGTLWNLDAIYVLSNFMRKQYEEVHCGLPKEVFFTTRNGIHLDDFKDLNGIERDRYKLVYASRPERGFENCIAIMEILARRGSKLRLEVSGYDNTPPQMEQYYRALWSHAQQLPNIKLIGPQKQSDWHKQLASARALIYPGVQTEFREIYCILMAEAQACGTPVVTCKRGAIPETLHRKAGIFLGNEETDVHSEAYREQFADALERIEQDDIGWKRVSRAGKQHARGLGWDGVAQQWEQHWTQLIEAQSADPYRAYRHMARTGDLELLQYSTQGAS